MSRSRFSTKQFIDQLHAAYICGICSDVLDEPTETPCQHLFCLECINSTMQSISKCPECLQPITGLNDLKSTTPAFKSLLNQLRVRCSYYEKCQTVVRLEDYLRHVQMCDFGIVSCSIDKCGRKCYRKDVDMHESECEYRKVDCPRGCNLKVVFKYTEKHIDTECVKGSKKCRKCKKPNYLQEDQHNCYEYLLSLIGTVSQNNNLLNQNNNLLSREVAQMKQGNEQLKQELDNVKQKLLETSKTCQHLKETSRDNGKGLVMAVLPSTQELSDMLSAMPRKDQKQLLDACFFPVVRSINPEHAAPITSLLIQMENSDLLPMLDSEEFLKLTVEKIASRLNLSQARR